MYYIIYKTTCLITSKFYVGKHKTTDLNDGYLGSGKMLKYAIKKYGKENFKREVLKFCDSEEQMNQLEPEYIVLDENVSYNICPGGEGGWGYVNRSGKNLYGRNGDNIKSFQPRAIAILQHKLVHDEKFRRSFGNKVSQSLKRYYAEGGTKTFAGKHHSEESKAKMRASNTGKQLGSRNSQYGTKWMNDGHKNIKVKADDVDNYIFMGYTLGRL